jgi:hypothetical protein
MDSECSCALRINRISILPGDVEGTTHNLLGQQSQLRLGDDGGHGRLLRSRPPILHSLNRPPLITQLLVGTICRERRIDRLEVEDAPLGTTEERGREDTDPEDGPEESSTHLRFEKGVASGCRVGVPMQSQRHGCLSSEGPETAVIYIVSDERVREEERDAHSSLAGLSIRHGDEVNGEYEDSSDGLDTRVVQELFPASISPTLGQMDGGRNSLVHIGGRPSQIRARRRQCRLDPRGTPASPPDLSASSTAQSLISSQCRDMKEEGRTRPVARIPKNVARKNGQMFFCRPSSSINSANLNCFHSASKLGRCTRCANLSHPSLAPVLRPRIFEMKTGLTNLSE